MYYRLRVKRRTVKPRIRKTRLTRRMKMKRRKMKKKKKRRICRFRFELPRPNEDDPPPQPVHPSAPFPPLQKSPRSLHLQNWLFQRKEGVGNVR